MDTVPASVIVPGRSCGGLGALWRGRGVLWSLTLREVQVRYRQAALGIAWALVPPVALMLVTTAVFGGLIGIDVGEVPYALFVFTALVPWTFFQVAVSTAVPSLVSNANLVRKIWFPREALPLSCVNAVALDLLVGLLVWVAMIPLFGRVVSPALLWVPVLLLVLAATTASLALLGSALNVHFRDVKHALPLLLQVLFFATPILYPLSLVPAPWRFALEANPLTAVVEGMRRIALEGRAPDGATTLLGAAIAFALLAVAYWAFKAVDRRFADVV